MFVRKFNHLPKVHKLFILFFSIIIATAILFPSGAPEQHPAAKFEIGIPYPIDFDIKTISFLSPQGKSSKSAFGEPLEWHKFIIRSGESLALIFNRVGISPATLYHIINSSEITKSLAHLNVGDEIELGIDSHGHLNQLLQPKSSNQTLIVSRIDGEENKFAAKMISKPISTEVGFASATITSNFWNAGISAGLSANQIMELAELFGWDIDFALDIRKGDQFSVLYEEQIMEGDMIGRGKILAATFTNQDKTFTAIRSESGEYFDQTGRAMKKAFLSSPVNFRYVSSDFNPRRLHPVTGQVKPHRGTDYVAPVGTPIWSAGAGIVMKSGYNKFNGNYVFIRHSDIYITKYLHLDKRYVKTGQKVKQGQEIGTLGSTGRVTGAHLHYEFLVNNVHQNPRTVNLPKAEMLEGKKKTAFIKLAKERLNQLNRFNQLFVAVGPISKNYDKATL